MNKKTALSIVQNPKDIKFIVQDWFERISDSLDLEHGGWDCVDDDELAEAMRSLTETEHAKAFRDAVVKFLQTPAGLKLIKENQAPYYRSAKLSKGDQDDE